MICPECKAEAFKVLGHIELGRSGDWFENTLQRAQCAACGAKFYSVYREARSLRIGRDNDVSHLAYRVPKMPWMLMAFAFENPKPKISATWRRKLGHQMMDRCSADTLAGPIAFVDTRTGETRMANGDR